MNYNLATLLLLLGTATALTYQDCVVSSSRKVKWAWSQVVVGAWVTPNITHNMPSLQFEISFLENSTATRQDIIQVYTNFISVKIHESYQNFDLTKPLSDVSGWLNITLSIRKNVTLTNAALSSGLLITYPVLHPAEEVVIYGSNITINCHTGKMSWRVEGKGEVMPLSNMSGWHCLAVYSNHHILPTIILGGRTLTLGWDNNSISTNTTNPLPPFTEHPLVVDCLDYITNGVSCKIKEGSKVLASLSLVSRPTFMVIDNPDQHPFYILQKISTLPPSHSKPIVDALPPSPVTNASPASTSTEHPKDLGWSGWWVFIAVLLAILLVFVIIMCVVSHYHRPKIEKYLGGMHLISESMQEDVEIQLQPERRPMLMRSVSLINTDDPRSAAPLRLWNAVASGEQEEVEQVLATLGPSPQVTLDGWDTSPYEEAHRRGHSNVLQTVEAFMHLQPDVPHNDMILGVLQVV